MTSPGSLVIPSKIKMPNPRRCDIFISRSAKCSNVTRLPLALHWSLIDDLPFRFQGERPVPWELRVEMASESPSTASPHEEEDFEDVDQVELLQPKLSLSIVAEDTLEVRGLRIRKKRGWRRIRIRCRLL